MKIISGKWSGRSISKKLNPNLRPTSNKVREAIFDILDARWGQDFQGQRVLDLFAGTGAFGFEALSRNAESITFVDNHWPTIRELTKNLEEYEAQDSTAVICKGVLDAISWLHRQAQSFDLIFLDPPYRQDWIVATLNKLAEFPILANRGLVIAEHDKREHLSPLEGFWKLLDSRRYGDTAVSFFCPIKYQNYWLAKFNQVGAE